MGGPVVAAVKQIAAAALCVVLASCASDRWFLNGHTQAELEAHFQQCELAAGMPIASDNPGAYQMGRGLNSGNGDRMAAGSLLMVGDLVAHKGRVESYMASFGYAKAP